MTIGERDTSDSNDRGDEGSGESVWEFIDRERAQRPYVPPPRFSEPIGDEALARLSKQIDKHNAFMETFERRLARRRSAKDHSDTSD